MKATDVVYEKVRGRSQHWSYIEDDIEDVVLLLNHVLKTFTWKINSKLKHHIKQQ